MYRHSIEHPEEFWADAARELDWFEPWTKVLEWEQPWAKWFVGGKLNLSHNCVDRHAQGNRAQKPAIIWEGEPGEVRTLTYAELLTEVQLAASMLKEAGVQKGDRVAIYMGMCPELAIALLAANILVLIISMVRPARANFGLNGSRIESGSEMLVPPQPVPGSATWK